jgi:2-polyprenyl-3-methyl-5-hydroxy-6-metoxy-1,4-benzoquinol methylase
MEGSNRMIGSVLSKISPLRDIVIGSVLWLQAGDKGRLLDVGCGNGCFLDQMKQLGWKVAGVEPDGEAVSVAREEFGLEVFKESLQEAKFPAGHFDMITMNHVIEHIQDPIGLLKVCLRVLRPSGKLIGVTPNINSLGLLMFDDAWLHWDPPRHLFLFSQQTMQVCVERAGLVILELRTTARGAARLSRAASSLIRQDGLLPGGSLKSLGPQAETGRAGISGI